MPFPGSTFRLTANEATLGPGSIAVLENGFFFEARDQRYLGFDFNTVRLVKVTSFNSFDVAYSIHGAIQRASFEITPKYLRKNEGIEKDVTTSPFEWELAFWKLHTITGAVAARMIADRSGARIDGATNTWNDEFDRDFQSTNALIESLPFRGKIEDKEKPLGGTQLALQLEEAIQKLTDQWLIGGLSSTQREKVAALCYRSNVKKLERGWSSVESEFDSQVKSDEDFGESANEWTEEESLWGSDLKSTAV